MLAIHVAGLPDVRSRAPEPPAGPTSSGEPRALQPLGGRAASSIFAEEKPPWAASYTNLFPNTEDAAIWNIWNTPVELAKKRAAEAIDDPPPPTGAACDATLADSERLLLTAFALPLHGSTALHQVLQSGPEVATACMGRSWQCEAILGHGNRCDVCRDNCTAGGAGDKPCDAVPCLACADRLDDCDARNASATVRADLELLEPYWEAQPDRRVLMAKWVPLSTGQCHGLLRNHDKLRNLTQESWAPGGAFFSGFGAAALTPNLRAAGVSRLRWAVVVLYRPWYMWSLSSSAVKDRATLGAQAWAEAELSSMENLVAMHKALLDQNVPVLINGYAEMLWATERFVQRVDAFAPCLGGVDVDWEPQLYADIWPGNKLKTEGSPAAFGLEHPPSEFNVDPETLRCSTPRDELYADLPDSEQRARAEAAENYLLAAEKAAFAAELAVLDMASKPKDLAA